MNESWHIPRASLAGSNNSNSSNPPSSSSNSSSNKSHSNPSTVSENYKIANDSSSTSSHNNNRKVTSIDRQRRADSSIRNTKLNGTHRLDERWRQSNNNNNNVRVSNTQQPKRGSHSSQGSSDSNNSSSQSISSGSLLLTTANLERFAEIHKKQENNNKRFTHSHLNSNYNTNLMLASMPSSNNNNLRTTTTKDAVISIEQNLDYVKTKDVDTVSMASSTHFTMVNGEGGPSRKTTGGGICSRGKQVTVLITTMSLLFLFVIIGMVYALELRAREMPKS